MHAHGSVSIWLAPVKTGDDVAVHKLWADYFPRLVGLAREKLRGVPRRVADEEDAASSAFDSFCRGAEAGRFPQLENRDDLWRLLVTITARKAHDLAVKEGRLKRGGGRVRGDSAFVSPTEASDDGWAAIAGTEPTPEFAAQTAEEYRRLLALLGDDELRAIAVGKMEGRTNTELADRIGCAIPTIERRLRLIRKTWATEFPNADA